MGTLKEEEVAQTTHGVSDRLKLVVLQQMAEALDDEAAGLNRRAASFEEEESALNAEIQDHLTEINRLNLRLTALRSERDSLLGRAETLRREAWQIKEDILDSEEELALESLGAKFIDDRGHPAGA
jgi:chromosome segregation ATPase